MKTSKRILTTILTIPLLLSSVTALALSSKAETQNNQAHIIVMQHLFKNIDLTAEQEARIQANLDRASSKPTSLALHHKPSNESRISTLLEGVNLTKTQKNQLLLNMDEAGKARNELPATPQILPELSEQMPIRDIS